MSESICKFLPAKNEESHIKTVRFVYETECLALTQPFVHPIYVLHIVTSGSAVLRIYEKEYVLNKGDIFFAFPAVLHYLDASEDFEYIYISFMGYAGDRVTAWLHPEQDPGDTGYQILQSLYAIGSGGLLGLGFGKSRQKYLYLPFQYNTRFSPGLCP